MSKKLKIVTGAAGVFAVIGAIAIPSAMAQMDNGSFTVKATNRDNPSITAKVGLSKTSDGGETGTPETPELDNTVVDTFTCGDYSFSITKGMVDWSNKNKASHAAGKDGEVKPYPEGGWNYMLSADELGGFFPGGEWGPTVKAYAFSKDAKPTTVGTWDAQGFSTQGFHNTNGPAFAATLDYGYGGEPTCSYAKAQNGLAQGSSATDPAIFSKSPEDSKAYFMESGKLISSQTNPASIATNAVGKTTAWAQPNVDWNRDVIGHPKNDDRNFDWALLDRGSKPGKLQEEKDGSRYEYSTALTRSSTEYFLDRFFYRADGTLNEYSSEKIVKDANGSSSTQVKPSNRINGPSLARYAADGKTVTEAYYRWEGGSASDRASYEAAGGTGWIGN